MKKQRTWRERHPFLYGLCMTFGIAQVRQPVEDSLNAAFQQVRDAMAEAGRKADPPRDELT